MATTEQHKDLLIRIITEQLTDKQVDKLYQFLNAMSKDFYSKSDLIEIADIKGSFDTATPIDYVRRVQEILPSFKTHYMIYDYRTANFGEFCNVAEKSIENLHEIFSKDI